MAKPFRVESEHINRLTDVQLTQLLSILLQSEAYNSGISQDAAEVALNIRVGDGGIDGIISWNNGPNKTNYLPHRLIVFQNKATEMGPAEYAKEIMTKARSNQPSVVKPVLDKYLQDGAAYIVFTSQELNTQQKNERKTAVREQLRSQTKPYADSFLMEIYDAAQIADWVNNYIAAIVSVQHWAGTPVERGLKTYQLWEGHEDISRLPYLEAESRRSTLETLKIKIEEPRVCLRIMGLSGLGKTRTAFQIFEERESLRSHLVYVDANHAPQIDALVADWVGLGLRAILVVDNCDYRLHESLSKEVRRTGSQISLLTLDYDLDSVSTNSICFRLEPMSDAELVHLLTPIYKDRLQDLERIVSFAQGFPQMAVLLAEARLTEDPRIGILTEDDLAQKLLWRRGESENPEKIKILQACSLFDTFGIEGEVEAHLDFIAGIVGVNIDSVFSCIQDYTDRGIIDRRGRYGQLVPKPLAIRLAGQWWSKTREAKQRELLDSMPMDMIEGFCFQIEKLDYHSDVKKLTEQLCGPKGPFGQAEVILSARGSRLFRSFVNVNHESTTAALHRILTSLNHEDILSIEGDIRRHLVWALEKLCFHSNTFEKAAWCMLLMAVAENESWSNNATGMFSQLYRINLSGTAAEPNIKFSLLKSALRCHSTNIDLVVLTALKEAINTGSGSRSVGAEYQGTKPPLEEWRPKIWQEIFDYWQSAFDLLLTLMERGKEQEDKARSIIGESIRGLLFHGRIQLLSDAIDRVISYSGRYWPEALDSLKAAQKYDSDASKPEIALAISEWLERLEPTPTSIEEKLKIIVVNPPWEHEQGEDGRYIDIAAENAKKLATEISGDIEPIYEKLSLLVKERPKQGFAFGRQLALDTTKAEELFNRTFDFMRTLERASTDFPFGLLRGIYERNPAQWEIHIEKLSHDLKMVKFYPDAIRTGQIDKKHLDKIISLVKSSSIKARSTISLSYGGVLDDLAPEIVEDFCSKLATFGTEGHWAAVNIIYMYCFGEKKNLEQLQATISSLLANLPIHKDTDTHNRDMHIWRDLIEKVISDSNSDLAEAVAKQIISDCKIGFDHGDIWNHIKPVLLRLMRKHHDRIWPLFGIAISTAKGKEKYWLMQLFERENGLTINLPSVFSVIPADRITAWCELAPETRPAFVAACLNIFEKIEEEPHPGNLFIEILKAFGTNSKVTSALSSNMNSRSWSGSLVPYLEEDKRTLSELSDHENDNVRNWVRDRISVIDKQIELEKVRDAEREIGRY
ncbi:hypothetical protein [Pseudomonas boanensis]|uniref:hypothetical protein n=1 Tax=Metapseudomonas boanensis TaxID=2822138 RepID=UPI0035D499B6